MRTWARSRCTTSCRACSARRARSARPRRRSGEHNRDAAGRARRRRCQQYYATAGCRRRERRQLAVAGGRRHETELPVWRSLLYVPVNVEKYVDKAHTRGADVHPARPRGQRAAGREGARAQAGREGRGARAPRRRRRGGAHQPPLALAVRDIEHSICPDVDGIAITKADSASHVRLLDELRHRAGSRSAACRVGHTQVHRHDRDAGRVLPHAARSRKRARASSAMNIGGEDFALETAACSRPRRRCSSEAAHDHRRARRRHHAARLHRQRRRLRRLGRIPRDGAPLAPLRLHGRRLHPSRARCRSSTRNTRRRRRGRLRAQAHRRGRTRSTRPRAAALRARRQDDRHPDHRARAEAARAPRGDQGARGEEVPLRRRKA